MPTSWHGSVDMHLALFFPRVILFKESTPLFLLVKLCAFSTKSDLLWFPKNVLSTWESLKVIRMFLIMCLHIKSFLFWFCCLWNGSPIVLKPNILYWPVLLQYLNKSERPRELFKPSFWRIYCLRFWVCYLWAFRVSSWCMFRIVFEL